MNQSRIPSNTANVPSAVTSGRNDYLSILDAAWRDHLAEKPTDAPTVISTFAGCGGSSLGYSMAGYRELLAVEWDDNAVATFALNFPDVPVYHGDIAALSVEEALRMTGLAPGELDVLDGSPPCQGFSTAGKRNLDDSRNQLFREYVRLLRGLRPKIFVMENVSGMVKGKMKLVFAEIMRELKASGYQVSARLMNAKYFNVPQSRERMIFIGVREDLGIAPGHPVANVSPVTIREALPWITHVDWDSKGVEGTRSFDPEAEPFCTVRLPGGGAQTRYQVTSIIGRTGSQFQQIETSLDRPMNAIQRSDPQQTRYEIRSGTETRKFYIGEIRRLCSFPDQFAMQGSYNERWARLGNSVPPLFMRAIAEHIRDHLLSDMSLTPRRVD